MQTALDNTSFVIDPNVVKSVLGVFNGWDANATNYNPFFKNKQPLLITVWLSYKEIGNLNKYHMQYMIGDSKIMQRYCDGNEWTEWT